MKKKVGVYYDYQNIYEQCSDQKEYDIKIKSIEEYCSKLGKITIKNLYLKKGKYSDEEQIVKTHKKEYSFKVVFGPEKKDIDTVMTSDIMEDASKNIFDICVIISGDTDFVPPLEKIKKKKKKVHVLCNRGKNRKKKGIDTVMTSDIMENASKNIFDICVIISGDTDFVAPIEKIVKKKKVHVLCNRGTYRKNKGIEESATEFKILPEKCTKCDGGGIYISEICKSCNGKGELVSECNRCDATGWRIGACCKDCSGIGWVANMCDRCKGGGIIITTECKDCDGNGYIEEELCSTCHGLKKIGKECIDCKGTGTSSKEKCKTCEGTGSNEISEREICRTCDGTGIFSAEKCATCKGTGKFERTCLNCQGKGLLEFSST